MFDFIAGMLAWFYDHTSSYGAAIGLLTFVVLVVSTPLTLKGTQSMLKMQILQPELKAIQDKYPKDKREEMNAELMAFYKDNNINPVGGCMPLLFQIPVFLVLYRVIIGLTRRATDVGFQVGEVAAAVRMGDRPISFEPPEVANFNPAYLDDHTALFEDLSMSNQMESLGVDIARSASSVLGGDGVVSALPYLGIVLVVGLTGWFQHRMIRSRNTGAVVNPTQEMIMKVMPFFLPVFSFSLPAAIVIYFLVSNLYRIGQQWYITYSMYHGDDSLGAQVRKTREDSASTTKAKAKAKGSGQGGKATGSKSNATRTAGARKNTKTKTVARSGAPGRNRSGREGSARTQVQPRARKKKKR